VRQRGLEISFSQKGSRQSPLRLEAAGILLNGLQKKIPAPIQIPQKTRQQSNLAQKGGVIRKLF
jgi:hypothetical protein